MTKFSAVFLAIILVGQVLTQSAVSDAGTLLDSIVRDGQDSLKMLDQAWTKKKQALEETLKQFKDAYTTQRDECNFWEGNLELLKGSLDDMDKNMDFLAEKIRDNEGKIMKKKAKQCENQRMYINTLKNNKILLSFIEFLRAAIKKAEKDGDFSKQSFAQRNMFITSLFNFLQLARTKDFRAISQVQMNMKKNLSFLELKEHQNTEKSVFDSFVQVTLNSRQFDGEELVGLVNDGEFQVDTDTSVKQRTDEEIGDKHIDNDKENIDVDSFESGERKEAGFYLKEILEILKRIEDETKESMKEGQAAQIEAGIAFVDYLVVAENEREVLDQHLRDESERYGKASLAIKPTETKTNVCHKELISDKKAMMRTQNQIKTEENEYRTKRADLSDQLEVFIHVNNLYNDKVEGHGEEFEDRITDHVEDGEFDVQDSQFDIDEIGFHNESKEETLKEKEEKLEKEVGEMMEESPVPMAFIKAFSHKWSKKHRG